MIYRLERGLQVIECMVGAGVGFRVLPGDVEKLAPLRSHVPVFHTPYIPLPKEARAEHTSLSLGEYVVISVGDSKEGWVEALSCYIGALQLPDVESITFNYDSVRPRGEALETFGGEASGPHALRKMFELIEVVINNAKGHEFGWSKLLPIDAMDIMNIIGENVVSGGVRRTAQICLFDAEDTDILNAKVDLWTKGSPNYGKTWRSMSNNSVFFESKPNREFLRDILERTRNNGEPRVTWA